VNGFATQGHTNSPYRFTNKNTDDDLINTFGVPTNEAERYFYNTCSEAIKRDKVVLYATRLPYYNESTTHYKYSEYFIDTNTIDELSTNTFTYEDLPSKISSDDILSVKDVMLAADLTLSSHDGSRKYYVEIKHSGNGLSCDAEMMEFYRQGIEKPQKNHFIIVDKNQEIYQKIPVDSKHMTISSRYLIGVLPVVTTATNALYYQKLIKTDDTSNKNVVLSNFEPTNSLYSSGADATLMPSDMVYPTDSTNLPAGNRGALTLSKYAMGFFPTVNI